VHCQVLRRRLGRRGREDRQSRIGEGRERCSALRQTAFENTGEVIGFENIELISDRPIDVWLDEFRQIKKEYPNTS
jgi:hypothetical protein